MKCGQISGCSPKKSSELGCLLLELNQLLPQPSPKTSPRNVSCNSRCGPRCCGLSHSVRGDDFSTCANVPIQKTWEKKQTNTKMQKTNATFWAFQALAVHVERFPLHALLVAHRLAFKKRHQTGKKAVFIKTGGQLKLWHVLTFKKTLSLNLV